MLARCSRQALVRRLSQFWRLAVPQCALPRAHFGQDTRQGDPEADLVHVKQTPLVDDLEAAILTRGPMNMSDFMRHCLRHPEHGYYMQSNVFGRSGDFITSPEISPLFGEHIAFWAILLWERMGKPEEFHIIELGPGTGKLMSDFLRMAGRMPGFYKALTLHMVDVSPALKLRQAKSLGVQPPAGLKLSVELFSGSEGEAGAQATLQIPVGPKVSWYASLGSVPPLGPNLILAHELFDALPVHQFTYTAEGWRELCVDVAEDGAAGPDEPPFRMVTAPHVTPALAAFLGLTGDTTQGRGTGVSPREADTVQALLSGQDEADLSAANDLWTSIQDVAARLEALEQQGGSQAPSSPLPHPPSGDDPASSETYAALRVGSQTNKLRMAAGKEGDVVEFSPAAAGLAYEIASRVALFGGGALIVDYGHNHAAGASVRGIKDHKFVSPLAFPGRTDLSVDVDFSQLAHAAKTAGGISVQGPITQSEFLQRMGIVERLQQIVDTEGISESDKEAVMSQVERLVSPDAMGSIYKFMAFISQEAADDDAGEVPGFPPPPESGR